MRNVAVAFVFSMLLAGSASAMGNFSGTPGAQGAPPSIPEPAAVAVFGLGAVVVGYALHRGRTK